MTIDGPSGSGKGTVSRAVARRFGWGLLDSGALYRLVALAGRRAGSIWNDADALADLARQIRYTLRFRPRGEEIVWLGGQEVTRPFAPRLAGNDASKVAALPRSAPPFWSVSGALPWLRAWWRTDGTWGRWYSRGPR